MRVSSSLVRAEDDSLATSRLRLPLDCVGQNPPDAAPPEALAHDEGCEDAARLIGFDQRLDVQAGEPGYITLDLGDEEQRLRVGVERSDPLDNLLGRRRIAKVAEERGQALGILGSTPADLNRYGGGGGPPGGGPSSSTYVARRPPQPP
jgi:hypothetical protein